MKPEVWKDIPGYEGFYQASNMGQIRNIERKIRFVSKKGKECLRTHKTKTFKGVIDSKGYFQILLPKFMNSDKKRKTVRVHTLIGMAWLGPKPSDYHEINHKNFDRKDNRVENLEWVTHKENCIHRSKGRQLFILPIV